MPYDMFNFFKGWQFNEIENVYLYFRLSIPYDKELDQKAAIVSP